MSEHTRQVIDVDAFVIALRAVYPALARRSDGEIRWDVLRLIAEYDRQTGAHLTACEGDAE